MSSLFPKVQHCPRCRYQIDAGAECCAECGLSVGGRSFRFDGDHDLRRLSRGIWAIGGLLSIPNLLFAAAIWFGWLQALVWMSCGTMTVFGLLNLVAMVFLWAKIDRAKLRADDGTKQYHAARQQAVRFVGWLTRIYFACTILVVLMVISIRSGV